ncbi:PatB family C-S lyase [Modicisalibacter sp. 'Wilcox']|uniref:MalY/PatB family protein n=1 Tax=Modicisalibacter sp. 'Wilcox' TaxID=2679914 RepID=UPI0013D78622|nr:PatB family C-S lyase [Modicisalibacter sp. 'Wilcox']
MSFDFATPIDRRQHPSQKWHRYAPDVLPLWVADMDFVSPPAIVEALEARVAHGVFGYGTTPDSLREALCRWSATHYDWSIAPEWQVWLPGVVPALHLACRLLTAPGEGVLTVTPIYPPFLKVAEQHGRLAQTVALSEPAASGEPWRLEREALEAAITPETRLLLWCHPHNPTGRVWSVGELALLAELAERHDLTIVSDELHCDLILDDAPHRPLAALFPDLAARIVTLWAPSKTFNVAGLGCACAVIPDPALRERWRAAMRGAMPDVNVLGMLAAEVAYTDGEPWRQALLAVLRDNRRRLFAAVEGWPGVRATPPEATYLAWLDLREAGLGDSPQQRLLEDARVALSDGADFGWPGFVRVNFGTPASVLDAALERLDGVLGGQA